MFDLISELAKLFEPELHLQIQPNNSIQIREEQNIRKQGTLVELNIRNLPENSIAFTLDYHTTDKNMREHMMQKYGRECFDKLSWPIKKGYMDVNRTCDFIIFSKLEQTYRVLVGELKSSLEADRISAQLFNSRIYVDYVLNLVRSAHSVTIEPVYKMAVFVNQKDKNFGKRNIDTRNIKKFYNYQRIAQSMQRKFIANMDVLPFVLSAPSGIANCDYSHIFGKC